jgi:hypothetical protein
MPRTGRDRLLDAINEGYGALLSAVEDTEGRGHRVSRTVLAEARKGEHEVVELARKWIGSPTSFFDNFEATVEVEARAQRRALELGRDTLQGAVGYGGELLRALKRFARAYRQTGDVAVDFTRDAYAHLTERVRDRVQEVPRLISVRPARRRARTAHNRVPAAQPQATEVQALTP